MTTTITLGKGDPEKGFWSCDVCGHSEASIAELLAKVREKDQARIMALEEEIARFRNSRSYIVGFNDGYATATVQNAIT